MVILEFTLDRIKLLEIAASRQKLTLLTLSKKAIGGLSDEAISSAVMDLFKESSIKKKAPLLVCVPRHLFTIRNLRLPSVDDAELRSMAGLQAGKQLPYPASELIWDFKVLEKRPDGYSDILLILGHKTVIDRFLNILRNSNLAVDRIVLSAEALLGWYLVASGSKTDEEAGGEIKAVVDIDTAHVDIIILRGNVLEYSRSFPSKDNLEYTVEEIKKTFNSYEKETSKEVASVVMTGIEEKVNGLKSLYQGKEDSIPIEFIHPLKVISMDYRETMSDYFDLSKDISFSSILGAAYNLPSIKMDFLHPELKGQRANKRRKAMFIKTAALLASLALLIFGIFIKGLIDKNAEFGLINLKIKESEPKVRRLREISQQIEIIKENLDARGSSVDVLREIFKLVPHEISFSVLDFELEKSLVLRGISTDLSSVFKFASVLEKSPYFENCQIKYAQKRTLKEKEFVDFEINCKLGRVKQ